MDGEKPWPGIRPGRARPRHDTDKPVLLLADGGCLGRAQGQVGAALDP